MLSVSREMVERAIAELEDENPVLQKLKNGDSITENDIEQLAELLNSRNPHITEELLREVYHNRKAKFIDFIKHIMGIEKLDSFPEMVTRAFEKFVSEHTDFNIRQLEFLNILKDFIIQREKVEKKNLIEAPFTVIHPDGIMGVFSPEEIKEIVKLTENLAA